MSLFREEAPSTRADSSLLSSLSFWLLNDGTSGASKPSTPSEIKARKTATKCVKVCSNAVTHDKVDYSIEPYQKPAKCSGLSLQFRFLNLDDRKPVVIRWMQQWEGGLAIIVWL